jgi:hypothetical protein
MVFTFCGSLLCFIQLPKFKKEFKLYFFSKEKLKPDHVLRTAA